MPGGPPPKAGTVAPSPHPAKPEFHRPRAWRPGWIHGKPGPSDMLSDVAHQPGDRLQLAVESLAYGGDGVARTEGFVVFIPFTAPGDRIEAELVEVKKHFARARLIQVLDPSPDRVNPACSLFGECGGCQYQHLRYDAQLRLKQRQVTELLDRLGGFHDAPIDPVVPCPVPYGYRNRIMVRSQWDKPNQRLVVGFIRADNRLVVDVPSCPIAEPALNEQLTQVRAHPPPKGGIKVTLRLAPDGWEVPPDSFFQNNFHLLPNLVETVRQRLRAAGIRYLIDAYCGVGFFALECAGVVERFTGVEIDKSAIKAARRNLELRGATNGDFIAGPAEEWIPALLQRFPPDHTAVIIDPPRVGCAPPFLRALRETLPAQVIYVSCHPATLARDLKLLCADGCYRLEQVTPLDMFPQTQHVECIASLRRGA
ncbi:MAG: class I SAM-dependent RNA methyltransferase [Verrucomicrobiae bacterium]|nr:class I SAM-dependent RNA methyltransferase [Verrucomicrobiae bacterium]